MDNCIFVLLFKNPDYKISKGLNSKICLSTLKKLTLNVEEDFILCQQEKPDRPGLRDMATTKGKWGRQNAPIPL